MAFQTAIPRLMQGRMMDEVLKLVMTPEVEASRDYLDFETRTHQAR